MLVKYEAMSVSTSVLIITHLTLRWASSPLFVYAWYFFHVVDVATTVNRVRVSGWPSVLGDQESEQHKHLWSTKKWCISSTKSVHNKAVKVLFCPLSYHIYDQVQINTYYNRTILMCLLLRIHKFVCHRWWWFTLSIFNWHCTDLNVLLSRKVFMSIEEK